MSVNSVLIEPDRLVYMGEESKPRDNETLKESIKEMGQVSPVYVRPMDNGKYGYLDGKRRVDVCKELNKEVLCELDQ